MADLIGDGFVRAMGGASGAFGPGGKRFDDEDRQDIVRQTAEPEQLKWPKGDMIPYDGR